MSDLYLFEDCMELNIPKSKIDETKLNWVKYNPRKDIERYGCSITSLDGNDSGHIDLDSVYEYNRENNTCYQEKDFCYRTKHAYPFANFLNRFEVGRCHYIKLPPGGHFPWHRDLDPATFRIIYTVKHCYLYDFVWLQDDKILNLYDNAWYFINTRKKHAVFSFSTTIFAVFNVLNTESNIYELKKSLAII